jgi:hypothetical protein
VTELSKRFTRVIAAIDEANAEDPALVPVGGAKEPRTLVHGRMATHWVEQLSDVPPEELRIAARGHHIRRWQIPRGDYPTGRRGYLDWRNRLHQFHADELSRLMAAEGYEQPSRRRVGEIVTKKHLKTDRIVQIFEDALCLVFLETQLSEFSERLPTPTTLDRVLVRTWRKMSEAGREAALELELDERGRSALGRALGAAT